MHQALARRYRPQKFADVVGQQPVVTTLLNAIRKECLAQAYLFSGSRGTGKTTLARILAKALNCPSPTQEGEPCCTCSSCREIATGSSLDVLEIDGASHRGIEDVRQMNETVVFAPTSGKYKIYIIDEVHMLTKEAFNALLKTLEEPPPNVKFFFATTEPHKILATIISRCQRFSLRRIPERDIMHKLRRIAEEMRIDVTQDALEEIAHRAEGGLRDAESLFEQVIAFQDGTITSAIIHEALGTVSRDRFLALEQAAQEGNLAFAFAFAQELYEEGKDLTYFLDSLIQHYRTLLLLHLSDAPSSLPEKEHAAYASYAKTYSREQLTAILDDLFQTATQLRSYPSGRMALEILLLRLIRNRYRIPLDTLFERLEVIEKRLLATESETSPTPQPETFPLPLPPPKEDPIPVQLGAHLTLETKKEQKERQGWHDTLLEFAAVELGGTIERKQRR